MHIRVATSVDAQRISRLLRSLSHTFTLSPTGEGAEAFFATITEPAIAALIKRDDIVYLVAETVPDGKLAGAAAMRDNRVLCHLFVDPAYQGAGLGRRLWECLRDRALRAGNPGTFIVNSSINAVPVYEKFGFVVASARVEKHGGAYVPMVLEPTTPLR